MNNCRVLGAGWAPLAASGSVVPSFGTDGSAKKPSFGAPLAPYSTEYLVKGSRPGPRTAFSEMFGVLMSMVLGARNNYPCSLP